jgi:hypothetical protein
MSPHVKDGFWRRSTLIRPENNSITQERDKNASKAETSLRKSNFSTVSLLDVAGINAH